MTTPRPSVDGRPDADDLLDNMAWFALTGLQAELADGSQPADVPARRYRRPVAPFSATPDLDGDGWDALAQLVGPGGAAILFRAEIPNPPQGWSEIFSGATIQYVADELAEPPRELADQIVELGPEDSDAMVELTALTEPGPFSAETWRTGRYFGLRRHGELVAMAGERMRVPGWGEVSAVCVHPSARGQGLGAALTLAAAAAVTERGDRAMLHVAEGNDPAHRIYREIGFEVRRRVVAAAYRWKPS